jgi:imidazolonepropionase-like amidohydrolase
MLAIRGARLFDGENDSSIESPTLLVDGASIVAVQSGGDLPSGAELVDLGDVTLLPGLVDAHLHLAFDASPNPLAKLTSGSDDELLAGMAAAARTVIEAGITTVRDLGDRAYLSLRLRDELAADPMRGPRVLAAGPPITTPRGHCWFLGGEADGVDGIRAAVREHAERGVDVIKVMASGGELTEGTRSHVPQFSPDELRAAVDEAGRHGLPITAHAHAGEAIANAVAAGVDSIEHCSFMTEDGVEPQTEVIDAIVRSGTVVSATLGVTPGASPPPRIAVRLAAFADLIRLLKLSGVPIVIGTDGGIGPPKPHNVLPYAVQAAVDVLGWSTVDTLRSVTSRSAEVCRVGDRKGRLAPGYDADILAVAGDLLEDSAAIFDVRGVWREGQRAV